MIVYAFDVDETLELSGGPVRIADIIPLRDGGHIVGLCGNWGLVTQTWPGWWRLFSFIGPMSMLKEQFLDQIKKFVLAEDYVMVGNIYLISGQSDDSGAALRAGWRFISETDFAHKSR